MQDFLKKKRTLLNNIVSNISNGLETLKTINNEINILPRNIGDELHDIEDEHKKTKENMQFVSENIDEMTYMINSNLYPKLDRLKVGSTAGLSSIAKTIDTAKSTTKAAVRKAEATESRVERIKELNDDMQASLRNLKNKILLARQKASNVRVSLSADRAGICVRSFVPDIEPSTTNHIVLNYAINTSERDSLLFFLANSVTEDFMIIEMVNRRIRFLWNAGGGTQVIEHSLAIENNDEQLLKNEKWYKIEVRRFGNVATLSVRPTRFGQKTDPDEVTNASPAGYSRMDLDSTSFFYVGGTPKGYRVPREMKARNFAGCLYEIVLDGKKVGLWNFVTNQGCSGCKEGATEEADFSSYQFRSDGYAILPQIKRYKKISYLVTLRFKTFDENSLIFFAPSLENRDFVSIELREGYIVYQFHLGSHSRSMLKTTKKYNTGNWIRLAAAREKLQGQLSVEEEFLEGQLPVGSPTKMEIQKSSVYFGGVPPNFTHSLWSGIVFQKFLGCMKDIQIDSTPIDLLKNSFYGVEPGCKDDPIKVASFLGEGHLEIGSHPLLLESSFGFTFKSEQENAVLLLSTFETGKSSEAAKKDYYSVAIIGGRLEARFNGGNGDAVITSSVLVNDDLYHIVVILKKYRKLTMRVDDTEVGFTRLPKGSKDIDAPNKRGLFFGGFKDNIYPGAMIATKDRLVGTIKDVIFNDKLFHFNHPVEFIGVGIGRSQKHWFKPEEPYTGVTQPLERCAEMASYVLEKRAVNFGDELYSYAKLTIGRKHFVHDFNVSLDFRTTYPNGLLTLVTNGLGVSHFAVMLLKGRVVIDAYDRKARRATSQIPLNDHNWHNVFIKKTGRNMVLKIDKKRAAHLKVRRKIALRSPLFVGGVPEETETISTVVLESFKGCIRNYHLNDVYLDLASGELHNVSHCFATIEVGAFFGGDAYAVYDTKFDLGIKLDIQMEFKTTRLNGVLLSMSSSSGVPSIGLELYNGSVIVSVALTDGEKPLKPFRATRSFDSKYEMCDGRWHTVIAQYAHKTVTLKVDMFDVSYGLSENIPLEPVTSNPLYIGGLPEDAPKGVLNVRDNFLGCIRNIAINDRRVDWIDMAARLNVLPNSCPTF